mmetsp:Transcript_6622/g.13374  ORF Transcript_6622/g.13374 Transcript_6622/m.13374 type:complete len:86 (-) Transcript_6622:916-1173(-)
MENDPCLLSNLYKFPIHKIIHLIESKHSYTYCSSSSEDKLYKMTHSHMIILTLKTSPQKECKHTTSHHHDTGKMKENTSTNMNAR